MLHILMNVFGAVLFIFVPVLNVLPMRIAELRSPPLDCRASTSGGHEPSRQGTNMRTSICVAVATCSLLAAAELSIDGGAAAAAPVTPPRVMPDSPRAKCFEGLDIVPCPTVPFQGQDGDYRINVPVTTVTETVLHDRTTGLHWERDETPTTFAQALEHCANRAAASFGGRSDWRVPDYQELATVLDVANGVFRTWYEDFQPIPSNTFYWTSIASGDQAFALSSNWGSPYLRNQAQTNVVRCVSGSPHPASFMVSGATVADLVTGLAWQRQSAPAMTWQDSLAYCEDLALEGETNWRLPSLKELLSIVSPSTGSPTIAPAFLGTTAGYYWSASPIGLVGNPTRLDAYAVNFSDGTANLGALTSTMYATRCVRGEPPDSGPQCWVHEDITFGEGTVVRMAIGGTTPCSQHDRFEALQTLTVQGARLELVLSHGFTPEAGANLQVFEFTNASGSFAEIDLEQASLPTGLRWETSKLLTSGELEVVAVESNTVPLPMWSLLLLGFILSSAGMRWAWSRRI